MQMGGTVGRLIGDWLRRLMPEPWTLIAAGGLYEELYRMQVSSFTAEAG